MTEDDVGLAPERPISLVDATRPAEQPSRERSAGSSPSPSWRQLAKRPTKESMREGLVRWKYSRWQRDRYTEGSPSGLQEETQNGPQHGSPLPVPEDAVVSSTHISDFAHRRESHERGRKKLRRSEEVPIAKRAYEVDVLYENQRGWFFFGIPLYSHSSLLNFDPGAWVTREGKDSAVNITNAQVPDPSWEWEWKSWYVDMGYDVDEEGWQYSLSFSRKFTWHGTHPWFHSFVRRRRWLRKRIKKPQKKIPDAAHNMTSDYFTIHSKRARSPGSAVDTSTQVSKRQSQPPEEKDQPPEDIKDIPSLLKALKIATIDREKIDAVRRFVETGGDELVYLKDNIVDIIGLLVFQASRIQMLEILTNAADKRSNSQSEKTPQDQSSHVRDAIWIAESQDNLGLEYWGDRQAVLKAARLKRDKTVNTSEETTTGDVLPVDEIKGIASEAEVTTDPNLAVLDGSAGDQSRPTEPAEGPKELENEEERIKRVSRTDSVD